jgi:hypothetical protein
MTHTINTWLTAVDECIEAYVPHYGELSETEGFSEWGDPFVLVGQSVEETGASVYQILVAAEAALTNYEAPTWIFGFDRKEPPYEALAAGLGIGAAKDTAGITWLNAEAARLGRPLRLYEVAGDGDHQLLIALTPAEWTALVAKGCLVLDESTQALVGIGAAKGLPSPEAGWEKRGAFQTFAELFAFLTQTYGQFVAVDDHEYAYMSMPGKAPSIDVSTVFDAALSTQWVEFCCEVCDDAADVDTDSLPDLCDVPEGASVLSFDNGALSLMLRVPVIALTPVVLFEILRSIRADQARLREELGLSDFDDNA